MRPEKRHLLHELLDEQSHARREVTLLAGGRILRRRRRWRLAFRGFTVVALLALAALSSQYLVRSPGRPVASQPPSTPVPVPSLTDAELLALFPDTPVGLITLENGKKRLIFPRPGDQERLVKHL
jgi:hypothetical protein